MCEIIGKTLFLCTIAQGLKIIHKVAYVVMMNDKVYIQSVYQKYSSTPWNIYYYQVSSSCPFSGDINVHIQDKLYPHLYTS
jgi:hypothetical protein